MDAYPFLEVPARDGYLATAAYPQQRGYVVSTVPLYECPYCKRAEFALLTRHWSCPGCGAPPLAEGKK